MGIVLPVPGEDPWGVKLNNALIDLESRLALVEARLNQPDTLPSINTNPASVFGFIESSVGGSFSVRLSKAPAASITIALAAVGGNASVTPSSMVFTSANWSIVQNAIVTSPNDFAANGARTSTINLTSVGISAPAAILAQISDLSGFSKPINTAFPVISGSFVAGNILTCNQGSWNLTGGYVISAVEYQWMQYDSNIPGETNSSLLLTDSLVGGTPIKCKITISGNFSGKAIAYSLIRNS